MSGRFDRREKYVSCVISEVRTYRKSQETVVEDRRSRSTHSGDRSAPGQASSLTLVELPWRGTVDSLLMK